MYWISSLQDVGAQIISNRDYITTTNLLKKTNYAQMVVRP